MSEQENTQVVQRMYAAYERGDVAALLDTLAEDVEWYWQTTGPVDLPFGGRRRGREAVARFFAVVSETLEVEQFEPEQFVAQGDTVVVLGHERSRVRPTGRRFEQDWAHVYTLRAGIVVRFRAYEDTAAVLAAFGSG